MEINIETKNNANKIDNNNSTFYYVQQFKCKIFKRIPSKIRKKAEFIIIFTYNFKLYHVTIGINLNLIDDYQKYKWKFPILNVGPNSDIIYFDYSNWRLILDENCLPNNKYKIISDVFKNTYDVYQS
jgi:hypothetical protein